MPISHILLVEGDAGLAAYIRRRLTGAGHRVSTAGTLRQARDAARGVRLDLIVLDLALPDGSGAALCGELRAVTDAPLLCLTGVAEGGQAARSLRADTEKEDSYYLYYLLRAFEQKGHIDSEDMPQMFQSSCRKKDKYL
ncbi:MAG: response regulator, partial [Eubacteriales bacterium]|nr:response regulator [Eubacteriales bacterium]